MADGMFDIIGRDEWADHDRLVEEWLAGHISIPGAVETEAGLLLPHPQEGS